MMNTWRSLCYAFYYLEQSGIAEPWRRHDDIYVRAAGDDVVLQVPIHAADNIRSTILSLTTRDKSK
jgi:hypothetical protein